jgi:hypothetical protein
MVHHSEDPQACYMFPILCIFYVIHRNATAAYKESHLYYGTTESKTCGRVQSAVFVFALWGISPPPFSIKEVSVLPD